MIQMRDGFSEGMGWWLPIVLNVEGFSKQEGWSG